MHQNQIVIPHQEFIRGKSGPKTKYRREFCEEIVLMGKMGKGRNLFAAKNNITQRVMLLWEKRYPDFKDASDRAREAVDEYHLELLRKCALKELDCVPSLLVKYVEIHSESARMVNQQPQVNVNVNHMSVVQELPPEERHQRIQQLKQKLIEESSI